MAKLTKEVRESNDKNIALWIDQRKTNTAQQGSVRCTYADVYQPTLDGKIVKIWSIQRAFSAIADAPVIEDCGINETRPSAMEYVFGAGVPCEKGAFYNPGTLHVGKLTDDVYAFMRNHNVPISTPYVLYDARRFTWNIGLKQVSLIKEPTVGSGSGSSRSDKKRSLLFPALLAAASLLID